MRDESIKANGFQFIAREGAPHKRASDLPGQKVVDNVYRFITTVNQQDGKEFLAKAMADADGFRATFFQSPGHLQLVREGEGVAKASSDIVATSLETEKKVVKKNLDDWTDSDEGREVLQDLSEDVIELLGKTTEYGTPSHDARHLEHDIAAGLRLSRSGLVNGYRSLSLIGSAMHDMGKLVEDKVVGREGGVDAKSHAILSYAFTKDLLHTYPQMPQLLKDELLYAVLSHQGPTSETVLGQLVQLTDRLQLVGPIGIERFFQCDVGLFGRTLTTPIDETRRDFVPIGGRVSDTDLSGHTEFYLRNLHSDYLNGFFENVAGENAAEEIKRLKIMSGRFLYLQASPALRKQVFAPEYTQYEENKSYEKRQPPTNAYLGKKLLDHDVWDGIKAVEDDSQLIDDIANKIQEFSHDGQDTLFPMIQKLVSARDASRTDEQTETLKNLAAEVTDNKERERINKAVAYILIEQQSFDNGNVNELKSLYENDSKAGSIEKVISSYVIERLSE